MQLSSLTLRNKPIKNYDICPCNCVGFEHDMVHKFADAPYKRFKVSATQARLPLSYRKFMKTSLESCDSKFSPWLGNCQLWFAHQNISKNGPEKLWTEIPVLFVSVRALTVTRQWLNSTPWQNVPLSSLFPWCLAIRLPPSNTFPPVKFTILRLTRVSLRHFH